MNKTNILALALKPAMRIRITEPRIDILEHGCIKST